MSYLLVPFIHYFADSYAGLNAISLLLFQNLIIGNRLMVLSSPFLIIFWLLIFGLLHKGLKTEGLSLKDRIIGFCVEVLSSSMILIGFQARFIQDVSRFAQTFLFVVIFIAILMFTEYKSYRKILLISLSTIVFVTGLFVIIFGYKAGVLSNLIFWAIIPNIMAYVWILAFGGSIALSFTNQAILLNVFPRANQDMYEAYIQDFGFYLLGITCMGLFVLLLITFKGNKENNFGKQLKLCVYLSLLIILWIIVSRIQFSITFVGVIQLQGIILRSIIPLWIFMIGIYGIRKLLMFIGRIKDGTGTTREKRLL
jgi:hypothetical protein